MLIIVDDYTRFYHTILMRKKSEAFECAKQWIALQERRTGLKVKRIRTDGGGEFVGSDWINYYRDNGIQHEKTVPYSAEQNGKAERAVGVVKEGTRTYLLQSRLPRSYWGAAVSNFTYTRNMLPTASNPHVSPFEMFYGIKPDVSHLRTFGCVAYIHIPKQKRRGAWVPRARKVVFIGYAQPEGTKAWVFYDPVKKERIVSVHATFWETVQWSLHKPEDIDANVWPDIQDAETTAPTTSIVPTTSEIPKSTEALIPPSENRVVALRSSARPKAVPERYGNYVYVASAPMQSIISILSATGHQPKLHSVLEMAFLASSEKDHREARFLGAKQKELFSMAENKVWELVPLPPGARAIPSRWLCTDKLLADLTTMEKARLIVMGHLQRAGRDFQEIFAPVLKMESVRLLLAMITMYDMTFIQGDVKTAFLYGPLEETVYMRQPPGFEVAGNVVIRATTAIALPPFSVSIAHSRSFSSYPSLSFPCLM
jgi:hypothetical protein